MIAICRQTQLRDLLERAIDAIDDGILSDDADAGILARAIAHTCEDRDVFKEALLDEWTNAALESTLGLD